MEDARGAASPLIHVGERIRGLTLSRSERSASIRWDREADRFHVFTICWDSPRETRLLRHRRACYQGAVKVGTERKFTIWTAPASSSDVPALVQLNMRAPIAGATVAKKRAASAKLRSQKVLKHFVTRTSAESLRKLVK